MFLACSPQHTAQRTARPAGRQTERREPGAGGCRNNLSYGRYWEGRTQLQQMTAKLSDAVRTALNFDRTAVPKEGATAEEVEEHRWFCDTLVHLVSLFHAVALATLRCDYDMENLMVWPCPLAACMPPMHDSP